METSHSKDREITAEELQELEKLKAIIERAIADGKLTSTEFETIKAAIRTDQRVSFAELQLVKQLIYDKIESGELEKVWE